ncbi:MAG TPA: hypothetical protein VK786_05175, partial [bacterium]|nr:hypothetical protein [bacterium]
VRIEAQPGPWVFDFYRTSDGKAFLRKSYIADQNGLKIALPTFPGSIAAKGYWIDAAQVH